MLSKHVRRIMLLVTQAALLVLLGLDIAPAEAGPLSRFLVDDDGKQCVTPYHTIQSAIDAAVASAKYRAKTVIVCEGTYPEQVRIDHIRNLDLIGRTGAVITPPAAPFTGSNVVVDHSKNISITTLTIDGGSGLGPDTGSVGIGFWQSTGKIIGNTVRHWRTADLSPLPGMLVVSIWVSSDRVRVRDNTVSDFLGIGIQTIGYKNRVTHNNIQGTSDAGGPNPQYGLRLFGPKAVANLNELTSDARVKLPGGNSIGIQINGHQNMVRENTVTGWGTGVQISGGCSLLFDASASHNAVIDNVIRETFTGVMIRSTPSPDCDAYAGQNRVQNNRIENASVATGTLGIAIDARDPTPAVAPFTRAQSEVIRGNHITNMETWFDPDSLGGGIVSFTLSGNTHTP